MIFLEFNKFLNQEKYSCKSHIDFWYNTKTSNISTSIYSYGNFNDNYKRFDLKSILYLTFYITSRKKIRDYEFPIIWANHFK